MCRGHTYIYVKWAKYFSWKKEQINIQIKLHHKLKSQEVVTLSKQDLTTQDQRPMTTKGYTDGEGCEVAVRGGRQRGKRFP